MQEFKPRNIYVDSTATHLYPRWWHKLIFWKKYKYQPFIIRSERMSVAQMKGDSTPPATAERGKQ